MQQSEADRRISTIPAGGERARAEPVGQTARHRSGAQQFGGSVIIENLFAMPGLGQASQAATSSHDFPALIGVVVVATIVVVITNLLLDILVAALDPKVRTA